MLIQAISKTTALQAQSFVSEFMFDCLHDRFTADQPQWSNGEDCWQVPVILSYGNPKSLVRIVIFSPPNPNSEGFDFALAPPGLGAGGGSPGSHKSNRIAIFDYWGTRHRGIREGCGVRREDD